MLGSRRDEEKEKSSDVVLSDRRARRKLKRGESVTRDAEVDEEGRDLDEGGEEEEYDEDDDSSRGYTSPKEAKTRTQQEALRARERAAQGRVERLPVVGSIVGYLKGVYAEVQKVTWPTREEAQRLTTIVIAVTVVAAIVLGSIDLFYGWWFQQGIDSTTTFLVVGIPVLVIAGFLGWRFVLSVEE